ncbi:MAG: hypothetical protein Q9225_007667 [Loekoesia sp. 1 TL-2023]
MLDDLRYIRRSIARDFALIRGNIDRNYNPRDERIHDQLHHHVLTTPQGSPINTQTADPRQNSDRPASPAPQRDTINAQGAAARHNELEDDEVEFLRALDFFRRFRILAEDSHPWNLLLTADRQVDRGHLISHYRTTDFLRHLADGHHDGWSEALRNQEYDAYFSDLWDRISGSSEEAASALGARTDPQPPPRIQLTIPPIYEPSDLPPYTSTKSPPEYSLEPPEDHITKDVPACVAPDCPVTKLGIKHSRGLYHHRGQVGPVTVPQGTWLPSFGRSNPPPNVWHAYNYMVLGIARRRHRKRVSTFVQYHGRPWRPDCRRARPRLTRADVRQGDKEKMLLPSQDQGRMGRIPCPQTLIPTSQIENQGLEENRNLGARSLTEDLLNILSHHRHPPAILPRHGNGNIRRHFDNQRIEHQRPGHQQSIVLSSADADAALGDTTSWIDPSAVPSPLRINHQRYNNVAQSLPTSRFSEDLDTSRDLDATNDETIERQVSPRAIPTENDAGNIPLHPRSQLYDQRHSNRLILGDTAANNHERLQVASYVIPPFPAHHGLTEQDSQPNSQFRHQRSRQSAPPPPPPSPTEGMPNRSAPLRIPFAVDPPLPTNNVRNNYDSRHPRLLIRPIHGVDADGNYIGSPTATIDGGLSDEDRRYYQRLVRFSDQR